MTEEIEKRFFDTFGIEPKKHCYYWDCPYSTGNIINDTAMNERDCNGCENPDKEVYPQITDFVLLELIVVIMLHEDLYGYPHNVKDLKENVLKQLIETYNKFSSSTYEYQQTARDIRDQVRTLFEEG